MVREHGKDSRICFECRDLPPPRARHCFLCRRCVAVFDHHCYYLDNCIGAGNQRLFFILTLVLFLDALAGSILQGLALFGVLPYNPRMDPVEFFRPGTRAQFPTFFSIFGWVFFIELCLLAINLGALFYYTLLVVVTNTTNYERFAIARTRQDSLRHPILRDGGQ